MSDCELDGETLSHMDFVTSVKEDESETELQEEAKVLSFLSMPLFSQVAA